jgi:uncharacterized membrane-anchored protein YjiN (DUF445 family)
LEPVTSETVDYAQLVARLAHLEGIADRERQRSEHFLTRIGELESIANEERRISESFRPETLDQIKAFTARTQKLELAISEACRHAEEARMAEEEARLEAADERQHHTKLLDEINQRLQRSTLEDSGNDADDERVPRKRRTGRPSKIKRKLARTKVGDLTDEEKAYRNALRVCLQDTNDFYCADI